jgi:hypothetical protein
MTYQEAKEICEKFALKHKVIFDEEGECGFGRDCVGFSSGGGWIDHNPYNRGGDYEPIEKFACGAAQPPPGVNAYHKHDCLAVLEHGEESVIQLAQWVKHMEAAGEVKIVDYPTGATGIQALMSGVMGRTVFIHENTHAEEQRTTDPNPPTS